MRKLERVVQEMDSPRFMTLTIRSDGRPLADLLSDLRAAFRRLREGTLWKSSVKSGIYCLETTYNDRTGQWHPHIHIIWDGKFVSQRLLSANWLQATGDSPICDVRAVRSRSAVARYIAKYVAKGVSAAEWPEEAIAEYADAMHGARLVHTFGKLHGLNLKPPESEVLNDPERRSVGLSLFLRTLRTGGRRGSRILSRLPELGGLWARFTARETRRARWGDAEHHARRTDRISRLVYALAERVELTDSLERRPPPTWRPDQQLVLDDAWTAWSEFRPRNGRALSG